MRGFALKVLGQKFWARGSGPEVFTVTVAEPRQQAVRLFCQRLSGVLVINTQEDVPAETFWTH